MDNESLIAIKLLEAIAFCNSKFEKLALELKKRPEVLSREIVLECKSYPASGTTFAIFLDAELKNGNCLNFTLNLDWNKDNWIVNGSISINDEQGYKAIKKLSEKRTTNFEELLAFLEDAATELFGNSTILDDSI